MGERDSSQTRVKPIFDELFARDPGGTNWLPKLINLPLQGKGSAKGVDDRVSPLEDAKWGNSEKSLMPPRVLLQWLVCCAERPLIGEIGSSSTTIKRREALLQRDKSTIGEALALLSREKIPSRAWYVLEGPTRPDVYLQTPEIMVVIEGKRTESGPTTETTWMPARHQMLRHLDCAWEVRGSRRVLGFFIVEGTGGSDAIAVPPHWIEAKRATTSDEVLKASLPHRTESERMEIAGCFKGVTTWQAVCEKLDLDWNALPDRIVQMHSTLDV